MPKSILSHRGYSISKKGVDPNILNHYKKELTIIPYVEREEYASSIKPIQIYQETPKRFYMPKYYGVKMLGPPDKNKIADQQLIPINVPIVYPPKKIQEPIVQKVLKDLHNIGGGLLSLACGMGKCLKRDTPIIMHDGKIKKVQDIKVGDQLMGDDSTPRNVLSLARGRETMYKITPIKGDAYTVNESHILSLKITSHKSIIKYNLKGIQKGWLFTFFDHGNLKMKSKTFCNENLEKAKEAAEKFRDTITSSNIIDIPLKKYLKLPAWYQTRAGYLRGYRVPITFEHKDVELDPYMLGYWLGDGTSSCPQITTEDKEVVEYYQKHIKLIDEKLSLKQGSRTVLSRNDYHYNITTGGGSGRKGCNKFLNLLRKYNVLNNKHIPHIYKCNSRKVQLGILAGLLDSDGSYDNKGCYDFIQNRKQLSEDVVYLCRSLGFAAYMKQCQKTCSNAPGGPKTGTYYRVSISGNGLEEIPVLLERKKAQKRKQIKDPLSTKITIEKLEEDDYYGFSLDGNRRFLLGDFQVTHNTYCALYMASKLRVKTMVVCHTTSLMNQWAERIAQFMPTARIGIVQQSVAQVADVDIIIASLKTLAIKNFEKGFFDDVGFVVWDEVHLMCTNTFSQAFPKCSSKYSLGLSATPYRKDRCDVIFQYFIGPVLYNMKREKNSEIIAQCITLLIPEDEIQIKYNYRGKVMYTSSLSNVLYNDKRSDRIVEMIVDHAMKGRKILILGEYIKHLKDLMKRLIKRETEERAKIVKCRIEEALKGLNMVIPLAAAPLEVKHMILKSLEDSFEEYIFTYGLYLGEMNIEQRSISEGKDVILGTYKLASVGMDVPHLNTLIMASPRKEIEQSVGRIMRKEDGEIKPLIIDIIDNHGMFKNQSRTRKKFYKEYGYTIEHIRMMPETGKITSKRIVRANIPKINTELEKGQKTLDIYSNVPYVSLENSSKNIINELSDECLIDDDSE